MSNRRKIKAPPPEDHWWSRKPPAQRRPWLSSRLLWNWFEFRHPGPVLIVWGSTVLVALMVLAAVLAGSNDDDGAVAGVEQQRETQVSGQFLPVLAGGADPAVGQAIPAVSGQSFDGAPVTIAPQDGPQLLVFLAHWCPHCQAEVPRLVEAMAGGTTIGGVPVVGVATGTDEATPNYPPSAWLDSEGWSAPVLADDKGSHAAEAFGLSGFPYFVAVGADGTVVARASGELSTEAVEALAAQASGA